MTEYATIDIEYADSETLEITVDADDPEVWRLQKKGGTVISNHRKKQPAVDAGKSETGNGDALVIHRSNGTVQNRHSY